MKLVVFSDPHVDIQEKRGYPNFIKELNQYLNQLDPDIILVTGDVAGSTKYIHKFLKEIEVKCKKKIFCPGNHDIWVNSNAFDGSWVKYYQVLPELCKITGWHYLPKQPIIINNIAFAGTMGWYDYSSRNPKWDGQISHEDYETKYNKLSGAMWMDKEFAKFGDNNDKAVADHLASELIEDLKQISGDLFSKSIGTLPRLNLNFDKFDNSMLIQHNNFDTLVIGTHIVPFLDFVKFTGGLEWDFFSAFIGNETLGNIISNITDSIRKISVFGHTHFPQKKKIKHNLEAICCPIGYPQEWEGKHSDLKELFKDRIIMLDI
ncbi:MAG: metallophosphoesterase [Candidatus Heimdallarchaeota archaeon]